MARATRLAILASLALAFLFSPSAAEACSCFGGTPICDTFWQMSAVFSGEVLEVTGTQSRPEPPSPGIYGSKRARFRVERTFRGSPETEIEIFTGAGGGDCGYPFVKGEKYLVFANLWGGRMTTSICSRTQRLANAAADLAYVSQSFPPAAGGRIYGTVQAQSEIAGPLTPAPGYRVSLKSAAKTWTVTSDQSGGYEFTAVPAGKYAIDIAVPDTLRAFGSREIELVDARGCKYNDFILSPNERITIRGAVVRADSRAVAGASIFLDSAEPHSMGTRVASVKADQEGRFAIPAVAGSRYRVSAVGGSLRGSVDTFELTPATAPILIVLRREK